MSKTKLLFTLVVSAFIGSLVMAVSGFTLWAASPGGGGRGFGDGGSTFVWSRQAWLDIHKWAAVALLAIIILHIYLHRKWLYREIKSLFRSR